MEEIKNETIRSEQPAETLTEDNGNQAGRTFTQEEVNEIVRRRLERERAKNAEPSPEMQQRLADLDARESRVACHEYLMANDLPSALLEVIDTSNKEEFITKVDKALTALDDNRRRTETSIPLFSSDPSSYNSPLASAFDKNTKHKPRGYYGN